MKDEILFNPALLTQSDLQANVFSCFAKQAADNPDAVAVIDQHGPTSYGDLAAWADAIARYLLAKGLAPEQPVGVLMWRRLDLLAVLLGVWKAGGAYVPLDPRDPVDRLRRMQLSSGTELVIGDHDLLQALCSECATAGSVPPRTLDPATIPMTAGDAVPLTQADGGERLAYLLFTSGSTGEPKAVEVEHRQVMALLKSACELLSFGPEDRYLAASTIAFDASITELFLPLVTGASLVLRDRDILLDPQQLARDVREYGITVLQTGPSVWRMILDAVDDFPGVRVAITHGEAVAPELARRIAAKGETVWNLYGPTETTVWATAARLNENDLPGLSRTSAPIGQPLAHIQTLILDDDGSPVPDGKAGELCLGGTSVARGYRNRDALTRERFVTIEGQRVYRTGDVVVRDAEGVLHYFGRNDEQIQVRGVRVEPGEVEAAILRDTRVAQTAATWFTTQSGALAVTAAIVLQPGVSCKAQELHASLSARLPSAMIPARFIFMPSLPMTTSGKVDRKAIREAAETHSGRAFDTEPGQETDRHPNHHRRKRTYTERALAQIWKRMLGVSSVDYDDHFFSIGGDSLAAVQMMVEVEARFGLVLPVHLAFEAPTFGALAQRIERAVENLEFEISAGFVFPLSPSNTETAIFFSGVELSLARRGLWTLPCPLFAITNWARGSGFAEANSLESLAKAHLQTIRGIQPNGPYRLAGFSMGGLIAYEMAQQLRDSGEIVELLFLLDPMAPHKIQPSASSLATAQTQSPLSRHTPLRQRITRHLHLITNGPGQKGLLRWIRSILLLDRTVFIDWLYYMAVNQYLRHPNAASRLLFPRNRWRAFWFTGQRLVRGYTASPYDGPILAVFCRQGQRGVVWDALLGPDTQRHELDTPHLALFAQPALGQWMGLLSEYMDTTPSYLTPAQEVQE